MNRPTPPLAHVSLDVTDPVLAQFVRFARDVAWRHRKLAADPSRFRIALEGYYRAWRISESAEIPPLDACTMKLAIAAYRDAHRTLRGSRRSNERRAA